MPALSISVARLTDLSFGTVVAGLQTSVDPADATAGKFQIDAPPGSNLSLTFTLPASLISGSATLAVSFGPTDAAWSDQNSVSGSTRFDPKETLKVTVPLSGTVYVWIGGSVAPLGTQAGGGYAAGLDLTAELLLL